MLIGATDDADESEILVGAEAHVLRKRGGYRWHLLAIGDAKDGDTGPVKDAFSANVRIELVEQLSNEHAVLAFRVIGDLARRISEMVSALLGALIGASPWE